MSAVDSHFEVLDVSLFKQDIEAIEKSLGKVSRQKEIFTPKFFVFFLRSGTSGTTPTVIPNQH